VPQLLTATAKDGSVFKCSDTFVRKFLYEHLRYVPRAATRAAQKVPLDWEAQCMKALLRTVNTTTTHGMELYAFLRVNIDQTNVIAQDNDGSTFAEEGSKQVALVGKEEKRAWTTVVGVSAGGDALPLQIIFKGASKASLPSSNAPFMAQARQRGFIFSFNPKTYWSSFALMKVYVEEILVPFWLQKKREHNLPPDQVCILQLDVWSVHRGLEFRTYIISTWPWIHLNYVPGGCTGLWQACDVGIQRPFKLAIKKAQLEDVITELSTHLNGGGTADTLKLDVTIGTLRDRCVKWFICAHDAISNPIFIRKTFERCRTGNFNLSQESVTSPAAIRALMDVARSDRPFWEELNRTQDDAPPPCASENVLADTDSGATDEDCPFDEDEDDAADEDDTAEEAADLFARILGIASAAPLPSTMEAEGLNAGTEMTDELAAGENVAAVSEQAEMGRGKRRKKISTMYSDYSYFK
jgi:hypothetical protein